jgi:hypothetical protein
MAFWNSFFFALCLLLPRVAWANVETSMRTIPGCEWCKSLGWVGWGLVGVGVAGALVLALFLFVRYLSRLPPRSS